MKAVNCSYKRYKKLVRGLRKPIVKCKPIVPWDICRIGLSYRARRKQNGKYMPPGTSSLTTGQSCLYMEGERISRLPWYTSQEPNVLLLLNLLGTQDRPFPMWHLLMHKRWLYITTSLLSPKKPITANQSFVTHARLHARHAMTDGVINGWTMGCNDYHTNILHEAGTADESFLDSY